MTTTVDLTHDSTYGGASCGGDAGGAAAVLPPAPLAILKSVLTSVLFAADNESAAYELGHWLGEADALKLPANPVEPPPPGLRWSLMSALARMLARHV